MNGMKEKKKELKNGNAKGMTRLFLKCRVP